jgi:hypothetical protein
MANQVATTGIRWTRVAFVLLIVGVFGVWGLLAAVLRYEARKGWTPQRVEQEIGAAIPRGTPRAQAQEWLDSNGFKSALSIPVVNGPWVALEMGLDPDKVGKQITARVPNPNVDWGDIGAPGRITVVFFFDKNDRLLCHSVIAFTVDERRWAWRWLPEPPG